jgi:hypothetical protein
MPKLLRIAPTLEMTAIKAIAKTATVGVAAAMLLLTSSGCDRRSAEEKGRDFANDKVGFAEGAAGVLEQKGKGLGTAVGKGVGDLVKGAGTAVKDVAYPPVKVGYAPDLSEADLKVLEAHEGEGDASARKVVTELAFVKAFAGRLQVRALDAHEQEIMRSDVTNNLTYVAGGAARLEFSFARDARLSKVDHYVLHKMTAKSVTLGPGLETAGLTLSQLTEESNRVTIYVVFDKAYRGGLQLRAANSDGQEIGRSEPTAKLTQGRDSATHLTFDFDAQTKLAEATSYVLYKAEPKPPAAAQTK